MSITIEGKTIREIEANILAAADEIRLRRRLLAEGCSCDLYSAHGAHCNDDSVCCETRRLHVAAHVSVDRAMRSRTWAPGPEILGGRITTSIGGVQTGELVVSLPTALALKRALEDYLRERTETMRVVPMAIPQAAPSAVNWDSPTTPKAIGQG